MATRLQKLIIALICGTALGASRCRTPDPVHPSPPPPDAAADTGTDVAEEELPVVAPPPGPMPAYGVVPDPEPPDQPMYGVPME